MAFKCVPFDDAKSIDTVTCVNDNLTKYNPLWWAIVGVVYVADNLHNRKYGDDNAG